MISWNCRGLGKQPAVQVLVDLVRRKAPTILFLMETKLTVREIISIRDELNFQYILAISCDGRKGGLALLWKNEIEVHHLTSLPNHIDVHIVSHVH